MVSTWMGDHKRTKGPAELNCKQKTHNYYFSFHLKENYIVTLKLEPFFQKSGDFMVARKVEPSLVHSTRLSPGFLQKFLKYVARKLEPLFGRHDFYNINVTRFSPEKWNHAPDS